jgi:hypothetical protein
VRLKLIRMTGHWIHPRLSQLRYVVDKQCVDLGITCPYLPVFETVCFSYAFLPASASMMYSFLCSFSYKLIVCIESLMSQHSS